MMSLDTFKSIVRFPADLGLILTGREDIYNLPDKRVEPVARQGQIAAMYWMAVDPKYLSVVCFGLGMVTLYAGVIADTLKARRAARVEREARYREADRAGA
jgi:hypothetical protein